MIKLEQRTGFLYIQAGMVCKFLILIFADSLLHFAKASIGQDHCAMYYLYSYFQASWKNVNRQKSQLLISENVDTQLHKDILHNTSFLRSIIWVSTLGLI
jgi:hypothetical protein